MWPFHVAVVPESSTRAVADTWAPPVLYEAEHHALALYGYHQQSESAPVHRRDVGLGTAARALHSRGRFSEEAVDRRFFAAATATTLGELVAHLRGLIGQLRALRSPVQPLDYSRLVRDLAAWSDPVRQQPVRRRWALQYQDATRAAQRDADNGSQSEETMSEPATPTGTGATDD